MYKTLFNKTIHIYGNDYDTPDGTCIRDYIHISDLAELHFKASEYLLGGGESITLNCGYGKGFSVYQVVNKFKKYSKSKVKINIKERRRGDLVKMVAKINNLKKFLKWKPKFYSLEKMVKSSVNWEKN